MVSRNYTVDAVRTFGALAVVVLHMRYSGLTDKTVNAIYLSARWAVPFFFLASGFFFEKKSRLDLNGEFLKTLKNLVGIFLVSNLIYFLIAAKTEYYTLADLLSLRTILLGDYIHLWFIGSLIFAYILLWFVLSNGWVKLMLPISLFILLFALLADPYSIFFNFRVEGPFVRFLLSVPFLFIGFLFSQNSAKIIFNPFIGIILALTGLILQFVESYIIFYRSAQNLFRHEFLLGTFIMAIGIFIISQSINVNTDNFISKIGRNYSLLIYLYHPLLIVVLFFIVKKVGLQESNYSLWFNPVFIFGITFLFIRLLEKKSPFLLKFISGKV